MRVNWKRAALATPGALIVYPALVGAAGLFAPEPVRPFVALAGFLVGIPVGAVALLWCVE